MVAMILAAGYGTRLYPLSKDTPKALLKVKGKPILTYLLEKLQAPGVPLKRIVLVSNHLYREKFQRFLDRFGLKVPFEVLDDGSTSEENRLGSVGDFAFCLRCLKNRPQGLKENLLVVGSDNLFMDPLTDFLRFAHEKSPGVALGAYALADLGESRRYGVLHIDKEGRILRFQEKPKEPTSPFVSTAVYFFPHTTLKRVLEYVRLKASKDTLGSFIRWLIGKEPVYAFRFRGPWFDIGDIDSYRKAQGGSFL